MSDLHSRLANGFQTCDVKSSLVSSEDKVDAVITVVAAGKLLPGIEVDFEDVLDSKSVKRDSLDDSVTEAD